MYIEILDEDISWVESIMGFHFNEDRSNIIKNLESIDIQAFPGSGKTTLLIAKLAILAKKWPYSNSGICVLSHTNVAREEIEDRLGNTDIGNKLLLYPHFIGTFQSFFDKFVAIPWLRSNGYYINIIDSDNVCENRWKKLPYGTKIFLVNHHKNFQICCYNNSIGHINWDKKGGIRSKILGVIDESQRKGNFTFNEMMLFTQQALNNYKLFPNILQQRFPIIFIDEVQDTNSLQWEMINKAFGHNNNHSIRQGFGDCNQAIFNFINESVNKSEFPRESPLVLSDSQRFDNKIAKLANTVALSSEHMRGTKNVFSERNCQHTIFLFSKEKTSHVINEFGQLVLNTFNDDELLKYDRLGCHVIGMVHKKKEDTKEKHFPKGLYDYWSNYDSKRVHKFRNPEYMIDYIRIGIAEFNQNGELSTFMDWCSKGVIRLINKVANQNLIITSRNSFHSIIKNLSEEKKDVIRKDFFNLSNLKIDNSNDWNDYITIFVNILNYFDLTINNNGNHFLAWRIEEIPNDYKDKESIISNEYIYYDEKNNRNVNLKFGSIHSVKGRTHLATLILETYTKTHNIKAILKYLCGTPPNIIEKETNRSRLKCQYVAMTRAIALICIAIPIDEVDKKSQTLLKSVGWNIKIL